MIIATPRKTPKSKDLTRVLKQEFSDSYTYQLFGLGSEKSILVRKSLLVGAQITRRENEIEVYGILPSVATSFFALLILQGILHFSLLSSWRNLEKEIALFFKRKYDP